MLPDDIRPFVENVVSDTNFTQRQICSTYLKEVNNMLCVMKLWNLPSITNKYSVQVVEDMGVLITNCVTVYSDFEAILKDPSNLVESFSEKHAETLLASLLERFNELNGWYNKLTDPEKPSRTLTRDPSDPGGPGGPPGGARGKPKPKPEASSGSGTRRQTTTTV
jgi:hypothetical protein